MLDAQVIGVPDEKYGEELMVWVQLREGAEPLTAAALREFCTGKLAHYKIPRYVHQVDEFPMTVTAKFVRSRCGNDQLNLGPRQRGVGATRLMSRPVLGRPQWDRQLAQSRVISRSLPVSTS